MPDLRTLMDEFADAQQVAVPAYNDVARRAASLKRRRQARTAAAAALIVSVPVLLVSVLGGGPSGQTARPAVSAVDGCSLTAVSELVPPDVKPFGNVVRSYPGGMTSSQAIDAASLLADQPDIAEKRSTVRESSFEDAARAFGDLQIAAVAPSRCVYVVTVDSPGGTTGSPRQIYTDPTTPHLTNYAVIYDVTTGSLITQKGKVDKTPAPAGTNHPSPSTQTQPASTNPDICGDWSNETHPDMKALEARHGTLSACLKTQGTWVLVAGLRGQPGQIGLMPCDGNATCLDGTKPRNLQDFHWLKAPAGRGLSLLTQSGSRLGFNAGTTGIYFDVRTRTFTVAPCC